MASAVLLFSSLTVSLILSHSITLATVDLALDQDGAVCGGEMAMLKCTTTTINGILQWNINSNTVFAIDSTTNVDTNLTVDGSFFVFTKTGTVLGAPVYTSTVSLNTLVTRTVQCTDNVVPQSRTVDLRVVYSIGNESSTINGDGITFSWSKPINSGVCCDRYLVEPSTGDPENVTTPSYNMPDQDTGSISVRCMDQLGTLGPKVDYTADITNQTVEVSTLKPMGDFCDGAIMYRANLTLSERGESVSEIMDCSIVGMNGNCSVLQNAVFFQRIGFSAFDVTITITYKSGFSITRTVSGPDTSVLKRACEENYFIHFIVTIVVAVILLIVVVVLIVLIVVVLCKQNQASPKADSHELQDKTQL